MHPIKLYVVTQEESACWLLGFGHKEKEVVYGCEGKGVCAVRNLQGWRFMVQGNMQELSALHQKQITPGFHRVVHIADRYILFWVEKEAYVCMQYDGYALKEEEIYLGRDQLLEVCIDASFISMRHALLKRVAASWQLQDLNSTNGCYVNGKRVHTCIVKCGDRIQLGMVDIIMGEDCLFLPQLPFLHTRLSFFEAKKQHVEHIKESNAVWQSYDPCPKLMREVELPPAKPTLESMPALFVLGPSITMGVSSSAMGLFSLWQAMERGQDMMSVIPTLLMSCSMALGTILWPIVSKRYEKRQQIQKENHRRYVYSSYLQEVKENIHSVMEKEARYRRNRYPSLSQMISDILQGKAHHQRRLDDDDWLHVVLGNGQCPARIHLDFPQISSMAQDVLLDKLLALQGNDWLLEDVPVVADLRRYRSLCLQGDRETCVSWLLNILTQLAIWQPCKYTRFCILATKKLLSEEKLFVLPHLFVGEERLLVWDAASGGHSRHLLDILLRDEQVQDVLIFVLEPSLRMHLEVLGLGQDDRIHSLEWSDDMQTGADLCLCIQQGKVKWKKENACFKPCTCAQQQRKRALLSLSHHALPVSVKQSQSSHFLDLFGCSRVEDLQLAERWEKSDVSESLKTIIGRDVQGELLYLDAHERSHGPHGLVAGMTGSGKSEWLLSYLLSLAVTYSWQDVSFLLIDFKGGTMANALARLPHTAGVITNLDKGILSRCLTAIEAELTRRQKLFAKVGYQLHVSGMDIDKYQRLRKQHPTLDMLPHLFLVADEFAELKQRYPQFLDQLRQCARIGRSLGIHLLLATQKPFGVVDEQIWSNARFHLCLKVADRNDSMDMLKKEDALHLRHPGEFLLQVGNDEVFQQGIGAWSQAPYDPCMQGSKITALSYVGENGSMQSMPVHTHHEVCKTQLESICEAICAQSSGHCRLLWLPALSKHLRVEDIRVETDDLVMGLLDDVEHQRQIPFLLSLTKAHNFAVCGMVGSGKSQFVETLIQNCLRKNACMLYLFDFDKPIFSKYAKFAQTAAVFQREDTERIQSFFSFMKRVLRQRRKHSDPRILLCILHNYEVFHELYGDLEEDMLYLLREGKKYGLLFCITTSALHQLPMRVQSLLEDWFLLQCGHVEDYSYVFGNEQTCIPLSQPGCGILNDNGHICMFQTAVYTSDIWQPLQNGRTAKQYMVPVLPKRVAHALRLDAQGAFLGLDIKSKEEVYWRLQPGRTLFLLGAYRFYDAFLSLFIHHLQAYPIHLFSTQPLYDLQPQPLSALTAICEDKQMQIVLWHRLDELAMKDAWMQFILKQQHILHIFIETMPHFTSYGNWEWYAPVWMDADVIWMGKGFQDHAYTLKKNGIMEHRLKHQEAYYWEEESCRILRLWEEEENG